VLGQYGINEAPIDLRIIINQIPNMRICSYSDFSKLNGCSIDEIIEFLGSELGAIAKDSKKKRYVIYYNDTKYNRGLDRFTVAHELGHYFLNHYDRVDKAVLNRGGFNEKEYQSIENEANCFARNLLSPVPLYNRIIRDPLTFEWRVMEAFNISYEAKNSRIKFLPLDEYRVTRAHIKYFNNYKMPYFDYCAKCNHPIEKLTNYCPICGGTELRTIWDPEISDDGWNIERRKPMFYNGIEVDNESKAIVCPVCNNEDSNQGDYCSICGTYIVNRCTNTDYPGRSEYDDEPCGALLDGNARYCTHCGQQSTFLRDGLLKPWNESSHNETEVNIWDADSEDIPF
jgi:Zn-dependent peptidase ImmA (M78 family)